MRFAGQVALVTGSEQNIGKGIALRLASEGARLVINGLTASTVDGVVQEIRESGGEAIGVVADVSDEEAVQHLFQAIVGAYGRIDILVNNAGIAQQPSKHFLEQDPATWDRQIRVNLRSMFLCSLHAGRMMAEAGRGGRIVNISSLGATRAHRSNVPYDASKGAMEAATRAMALDLAPYGITVNAVAPGLVRNHRVDLWAPDVKEQRAEMIPLGRIGSPDDVAGAVAFLCSPDGAYVTGQCFAVDGGMAAQLRPPQLDLAPVPVLKRS